MSMQMVFTHELRETDVRLVQAAAPGWTIHHGRQQADWLPHAAQAAIVIGWNEAVEQACLTAPERQLRWLHVWGAGVDTLPLQRLHADGIHVTNSSGVHAFPIAETVFAMMLAFTRKIHVYIRQQQRREWHHAKLNDELHGQVLGILGVGAIGAEVARIGKAFGMTTIGLRRSAAPHPHIDRMMDSAGLAELCRESDYIVNTLPLTDATQHLVGHAEFAAMKPSAFYVNIGRGGTTDTAALVAALENGQLAGAGLDVFEQEPLPADHRLWELDNVILTPHSSGSTRYYDARAMDIFLRNLRQYVSGQPPTENVVDCRLQY